VGWLPVGARLRIAYRLRLRATLLRKVIWMLVSAFRKKVKLRQVNYFAALESNRFAQRRNRKDHAILTAAPAGALSLAAGGDYRLKAYSRGSEWRAR
jgi:hypothetical protein